MSVLKAFNLPTSRDENWKYANLRPLEKVRFDAAAQIAAIPEDELPAFIEGYTRYVFIDGLFAPHLSGPTPHGTAVEILRSVTPAQAGVESDQRFALFNSTHARNEIRIVATDADRATCIELIFVATTGAQSASSYPRIELQAGERARVGLVERHVSLGSDANFVNCAVQVNAAKGASVEHYRLQQAGAKSTWIDTLSAVLAADAAYRLHLIQLGALSARSTMDVALVGERAEFELHSAALADRQQVQDAYVRVDHAAPNTRSRQTFRGIAASRARAAFNSKVVVREGSRSADSYQSLRGLLAGTEAEIDVRPQLEIYTDDVRCAHGATAGKLDDAMLFYLLSRGIDRDTAQKLLKWAFLEDVVSKIEVPALRRQIERSLAGQMSETAALQELL